MRVKLYTSLAKVLMDQHGLQGWSVRVSLSRKYLGRCYGRRRIVALSKHHLLKDSAALIVDTIKHEIAHALCSANAGHGPEWAAKAVELGADPNPTCMVSNVVPKWEARCCSRVYRKNRVLRRRVYRCRRCGAALRWRVT